MKNSPIPRIVAAAFACGLVVHSVTAQTITQTITLQPGWNAVWLEVQPEANSTDTIFSTLRVATVWTRAERLSPVEFIQDPSEEAFNRAEWLAWFHPSRPEAFLGNLFSVHANRAYLIKMTNSSAVNWNIVGRPSLRTPEWIPDSYNFRGLPVDPLSPPTFLNFFRPSTAHYDAASGQLQRIYRLNASGQWAQVAANDLAKSGEAYWIFANGASQYLAPLGAQVDLGDGLDFGSDLTELSLRVNNSGAAPASALLRDIATPANDILSYYRFDPAVGGQWPVLPNPLAVTVAAESQTRLRLAARRQNLSGAVYSSVLDIRDGAGTRLLVPVSIEKPSPQPAAGLGQASAHTAVTADPMAGLWVGAATINKVSEANSANPTNLTPTKSELNLRLLVHVDASGQARLLKEVLQMWRDGTHTNDVSGNRVVDKPGQYVLLTDDSLIAMFNGAALRDGQSVGRRLSTVGYDFPSSTTNNFLNLSGDFAVGQNLTGTLTLPFDHPRNPFKHKYHPDHDNLDASFVNSTTESFTTSRQIELSFMSSPPAGPAVPDFGYNEMGGTYRENITGIHKSPIRINGTFRLSRLSLIAELNPTPTP